MICFDDSFWVVRLVTWSVSLIGFLFVLLFFVSLRVHMLNGREQSVMRRPLHLEVAVEVPRWGYLRNQLLTELSTLGFVLSQAMNIAASQLEGKAGGIRG